jgi:hypothetical protein
MFTIRVFLSSPGDVQEERDLARQVIRDELPVRPHFRNRVHLDVISWDDPNAPATIDAHITPQDAITRGLPRPSDCDVVIVILWSRIGTPLPRSYKKANGGRYSSGTEWEFEDAVNATKPRRILVYRRVGRPDLRQDAEISDPFGSSTLKAFRPVHSSKLHHLFPRLS